MMTSGVPTIAYSEMMCRLLVSAACGICIGLERELRAKDAGVRTHFLVCVGSTLIMIVSACGFSAIHATEPAFRCDVSRVAAQIVSGIGFIGAGTIMMNKHAVTGLTTAAGIWAAAGIGMAFGGGLYRLGLSATLVVMVGLELLQFLFRRIRVVSSSLAYTTGNADIIMKLDGELRKNGWRIISRNITDFDKDGVRQYRVELLLKEHAHLKIDDLVEFVRQHGTDIFIERVE